ncbi:MAG TPA: ABC transporter substrate-binding protein [Gemmatales bacterium]|nr:ABC transporter substrate-binding protein [Gemmatales bacterium]
MAWAWRRWLVVLLCLVLASPWVTTPPVTAQGSQPPTKPREEEDDPPPPPPTRPTTPAPGASVPPPPVKAGSGQIDLRPGPFNLTEESKTAPHPAAKKLLEDFARPADTITVKSAQGDVQLVVEPLPRRYNPAAPFNLRYKTLDGQREGIIERDQIVGVTHYELRAQADVRRFLTSGLEKSTPPALSRFQMLRVAEMVMSEVASFHDKARGVRIRVDGWDELGTELNREVLQLRIAQVSALAGDQEWEAGAALADRLHNQHPSDLKTPIQELYLAHAMALLDREDFLGAYKIYKSLGQKYSIIPTPGNRVERRMMERARERFETGRRLVTDGQRTEALKALEEAAQAWPELRGLREFIREMNKSNPVLVVGVRNLPDQISPTTAVTDMDRAAVRLVFEPLLQARSAPSSRNGFMGPLGEEPRRVDANWEFVVPTDLKWSDGQPVTSDDILRSIELTTKPGTLLYNPDTEPLQVSALDARRVGFSFRRAMVDPLTLLCFDIVPAQRLPRERSPRDPAFGKNPLGTGPFTLLSATGEEVVFQVNPNYRRLHAPEGPALSEIRFIKYSNFADARQALASGRWQMLLDLTTPEKEQLAGVPQTAIITPTESTESSSTYSLNNPRIWFLAPNHRKPALQNEDLRQAISLALDRENLLQEVYRGRAKRQHQVLTGPYPLDSWAYNPDLVPTRVTFFNPQQARQRAQASGFSGTLTLRHAVEDEQAGRVCVAMQKALETHAGLRINVEGMPTAQIVADFLSDSPTFDLVYWHFDFPDESLSLWPLFDPRSISPAGQNIIGYRGDSELERLFRLIQSRRDFEFLRRRCHEVHDHVWKRMLIVPLWQLDRHHAIHTSLEPKRVHPVSVFDEIELWKRRVD